MGVRRRHGATLSAALALISFFFAMAMVFNGSTSLVGISQKAEEVERPEDERWQQAASGRRLAGPGSSPPTCRLRCGFCSPCQPVHVAIQPGRSFPLEYYPEAWRCKCGNNLFMP